MKPKQVRELEIIGIERRHMQRSTCGSRSHVRNGNYLQSGPNFGISPSLTDGTPSKALTQPQRAFSVNAFAENQVETRTGWTPKSANERGKQDITRHEKRL